MLTLASSELFILANLQWAIPIERWRNTYSSDKKMLDKLRRFRKQGFTINE